MTTPDQPARTIRRWFEQARAGGLVLPDGWFGRPYDNQLRLTYVEERPRRLLVELDNDLLLVFTMPLSVGIRESRLEVTGFAQLLFAWQEFGSGTPYFKIYHHGTVSLIPPAGATVR